MKKLSVVTLTVLIGLLVSGTASASTLLTLNETPVREKPDEDAPVLATVEPFVKLHSAKRRDFWFLVSVEVDGKIVSGWVNQTDVSDMMGRSKGQLLAQNDKLLEEFGKLRKQIKAAQVRLEEQAGENATLKEELEALRGAVEEGPGPGGPGEAGEALARALAENKKFRRELDAAQAKLHALEAENENLTQGIEDLRQHLDELKGVPR